MGDLHTQIFDSLRGTPADASAVVLPKLKRRPGTPGTDFLSLFGQPQPPADPLVNIVQLLGHAMANPDKFTSQDIAPLKAQYNSLIDRLMRHDAVRR